VKKISIVGTVGIPAKYGGFETLVENLTKHLSVKYDITVFCSSKHYNKQLKVYNNAKLEYINLNANGIESIPYDAISILKSLRFADIILLLGVSGAIILPLIKKISKVKVITNVDGIEWKRDKWNYIAKKFLKLSEQIAAKYSDAIIADNRAIYEYIRREYNRNSHIIPYGGDHVKKLPLDDTILKEFPFLREKYACTVCRIEPENNIHLILQAFSELRNLNLVIVGNWESSKYGKKLKKQYSNHKNIFLINPIYNPEKIDKIRGNCQIYIHGHSAGGTNPSLVEAMYLGLPILAYDVIYNRYTTMGKALYFRSPKDIVNIIKQTQESTLNEIGLTMKEIAKEHYTWKKICNKYAKIFENIINLE